MLYTFIRVLASQQLFFNTQEPISRLHRKQERKNNTTEKKLIQTDD